MEKTRERLARLDALEKEGAIGRKEMKARLASFWV